MTNAIGRRQDQGNPDAHSAGQAHVSLGLAVTQIDGVPIPADGAMFLVRHGQTALNAEGGRRRPIQKNEISFCEPDRNDRESVAFDCCESRQ